MNALQSGLRTLTEALAGLDDPHCERFSRIEERLRELEERLDQIGGLASASPERPNSSSPTETVAATGISRRARPVTASVGLAAAPTD